MDDFLHSSNFSFFSAYYQSKRTNYNCARCTIKSKKHNKRQTVSFYIFILQTENVSYSRALPNLIRNFHTRPSRILNRSKTDMPLQQLQATVIIPTLNISPHSQSTHLSARMNAYRYQIATRSPERSPSSSLRDASYGLRRIS